jgi:hypothetical protein
MNNPSKSHERYALLEAIAADPELPPSALNLAMALMAFVNGQTGLCCPAQVTIRGRCHLSRNTIDTATRALERRGWLWVERDHGGDRDSNRYHFKFERVREGGDHYGFTLRDGWKDCKGWGTEIVADDEEAEFHGSKIEPCPAVHGSNSEPSTAQNLTKHGSKIEPELQEVTSKNGTQESLFGVNELPTSAPFDFDSWFEQKLWPQFPKKVGKAAAKKLCRATMEGRRRDGVKTTADKMLAGLLRYGAAMTGRDPAYIKHPLTWISQGCWDDEYGELRRRSAVWDAVGEMADDSEMAVLSKRGVG